jgi:dTDP-4-amino-4,6-dideoxygalactose transaminase
MKAVFFDIDGTLIEGTHPDYRYMRENVQKAIRKLQEQGHYVFIASGRSLAFLDEKIRNFGFDGPESFAELGINGKNSEYHAAMGLANLKYLDAIHQKRKELTARYDEKLKNLKARRPIWHSASENNFAYYPLVFESEALMLQCVELLKLNEVFTRRYFYPSLATSLPYVKPQDLPVTGDIAQRVLCLPLYYDLTLEEVDLICRLILRVQNN